MKSVLTNGTFDLLHFGHIEILCRAKIKKVLNISSVSLIANNQKNNSNIIVSAK